MKLFRLCSDQVQPQHPLPWNVYNDSSQLLLSRGYVLQDIAQVDALMARGVYVDQLDYDAQQQEAARQARRQDAVTLWESLHQRMAQLLTQPADATVFQQAMNEACDDIRHALAHRQEASLFELLHTDDPASYAVSHSVQTAFVANLIGQNVRLSLDVGREKEKLTEERDHLRRTVRNRHGFDNMVGHSAAMRRVFEQKEPFFLSPRGDFIHLAWQPPGVHCDNSFGLGG